MRAALAVPIDELTENELVDLAKQLDKTGRSDLATSVRTHLLFDYPQGRYTEQTFSTLAALPESPLDRLSFDDALALAQSLAKYDRYDQEFDVLSRIAKRFPNAQTNAALRNTRIRAQFHSRNYAQLLTETANEKLDDPAIALMRARAARRAGHADEFLAGLDAVEKQWPSSPTAAEAKILRSKYYSSDVVDYPKAIENLTSAIAAGDTGNDGENLWTLGFTQMLAGRADDALRTFDDYVRRYPDGDYKTNALFWSGKIADKRGDSAIRNAKWSQLVSEYPYSYFSYRAQALGGSALTPTPSTNAFPNLDAEITAAADPRVDVVRELAAIDLHRDASQEMQRVVAAHPDNRGLQFLQADLYVEGGEPFKANNVLQRRFREFIRHGGTGIPQRFWQILFPLKYWDSYKAAGAQQNVDPYLLAAITRQESGFEPRTVSNAGAVGLMQIMPAEAASISQRANLGAVTREQLFDPATNISVGAAEFAQKRAAMNGNETLAIAAYNAGEDAVGKWLAQTPVDDIDLFVEAIPYAETRLYVKTVSRNRYEYRRIYETSSTSSSSQQKP
jgi:soluble lytic murein transglycosylase